MPSILVLLVEAIDRGDDRGAFRNDTGGIVEFANYDFHIMGITWLGAGDSRKGEGNFIERFAD